MAPDRRRESGSSSGGRVARFSGVSRLRGVTQFTTHQETIAMLARASFRLLLLPIALVAAGCEDNEFPFEPLPAEEPVPVVEPASGPLEDLAYWADGYLQATNP